MALKDWKRWLWRPRGDYFSWRKKLNQEESVAVLKEDDSKIWEVQTYPEPGISPTKKFKIKSQALAYAKNYMRNN